MACLKPYGSAWPSKNFEGFGERSLCCWGQAGCSSLRIVKRGVSVVVDEALRSFRIEVAEDLQRGGVVGILGVVLLVLLEPFELVFKVAHFGEIACGAGFFDVDAVLLDVVVDGFHAENGRVRPQLPGPP